MPKKINFKVQRASGEDEKYRASELDSHGPSVRGWLSNRNCTYPQELLFLLSKPAVIHQIQILAHHYIIPERIDVWIGPEDDVSGEKDENEIQFEYIGYITLSSNENTKFKCRELKTITIPSAESTKYVKLILYENHVNNLNVYNQVGLVAIQIIGEEVVRKENQNNGADGFGETSCFDDLAFEMYVDNEIAELLKQLEEKKKKAVSEERFEYARKLKMAMSKLQTAGEKLGKMEISKKQAIQQEDYSKAKKKKLQIEEFKSQIYSNLNINDLLEKNGIVPLNDEEQEQDDDSDINSLLSKDENKTHRTTESIAEVDSKVQKLFPSKSSSHVPSDITIHATANGPDSLPGVYESPVSPLHIVSKEAGSFSDVPIPSKPQPSSKTGSLRRKDKGTSNNRYSYESDENSGGTFRPYYQVEPKDTTNNVLSQILLQSKLNEREKKQAILSVNIFGKVLVEKIFSKQYSDKEESLKMLEAALKSFIEKAKENKLSSKTHSSSKIARASTYLLHRCLRDKVFAVYSSATEVIRFFFCEFISAGRVPASEIARSVESILPDLLSKAGDTTPRVHNLAVHTILSLADAAEVRKLNIIPGHLTRILTANIHARLALSRLEMVEQLILNHGISSDKQSGMTCRILAEFGLSGLHHPAEAVRKMAEKILVLVYHSNPRLVRRQLPPDDDVTRRNILYRHLMQEFDRVDKERKNNSRSDISEKEIVSKYSDCFGKTLHKAKSEQKLRRCIFCHLESDLLTEKELNIHYWKHCPMLMRCTHCNQVIEIAALHEHLTDECEMKSLYRKCQVCLQAVGIEDLNVHHTSVQCTLMTMKKVCPLCFTELDEGEDKLRLHLSGNSTAACTKHPRSKYLFSNVRKVHE